MYITFYVLLSAENKIETSIKPHLNISKSFHTKRSIFLQISINCVYTMFKDKKMELLLFGTGHVYRTTGTAKQIMSTANNTNVTNLEPIIEEHQIRRSPSTTIQIQLLRC